MDNINVIDFNTSNEYTGIKVISLSSNPDATIDVKTILPADGFAPGVAYNLGTISEDTTFTLASGQLGARNKYYWTFDIATTTPTITWPSGLTWGGGSSPSIQANKHYEILVINDSATYIISD